MKDREQKKIIKQLMNGSTKSLEEIHKFYSPKIYGVCRKFYLNHEDSEEVVQDVFLKIWSTRERVNPNLSFKAFIFKIARNLILKKLQKKVMKETIDNYIDHISFSAKDVEEKLFLQDTEALIDKIIEKLPPKKQKIFLLNRNQNKYIDEIASELGLSPRTVESHIYQTRSLLKDKLNLNFILLIFLFLSFFS